MKEESANAEINAEAKASSKKNDAAHASATAHAQTEGSASAGIAGDQQDHNGKAGLIQNVGRNRRWKTAIAKAKDAVGKLTLEERVALMTGVGWERGPLPRCVGNIAPQKKIGFEGLCLQDSPVGVRFADLVTPFPTGITTAATFSKDLAYKRGVAQGQQARAKGVSILLGPGLNFGRAPAAGRNWEYGGEDPYLIGVAGAQNIKGIQSQHVQACAKHFVLNDQETLRNTYSSNVDERSLYELYLHPFKDAVEADTATVMASYNRINETWATENPELLGNILKYRLGHNGATISDWGAQHNNVESANGYLDMAQPGQTACCDKSIGTYFWNENLVAAVNNGSVPADRVADAAERVLAGYYLLDQDQPHPKPNFDSFDPLDPSNQHVNVIKPEHVQVAREVAAAGTVLLQNKKKALPLNVKKLRKLAVIGPQAGPAINGANAFGDRGGVDGYLGMGWGSGTAEYPFLVDPLNELNQLARKTPFGLYWSLNATDYDRIPKVADERLGVDAALVFVYADSGEGYISLENGVTGDRSNLTFWNTGPELIKRTAAVNSNTIVIVQSPDANDYEDVISNPNVTAIIWSGMGGEEGGSALVDVLTGKTNPSGRLPFTIAKKRSDYSADVNYFPGLSDTPASFDQAQLPYTEKLEVGYRHFDAKNIEPRFAFGHGLSYTSFKYSGARGKWLDQKEWNSRAWSWPTPKWINEPVSIADPVCSCVYEVSFTVQNSGGRDGHEVPQVYLSFPAAAGEPPKVLRLFDRVPIPAGQSKHITWQLTRYDLSIWSTEKQRWIHPAGDYKLQIGASSRDIRLNVDFKSAA
ncbi:putative beta-glucosidase [Ceraceosorus guamensis]|uniref:beta-glucosidase n=1 Tax=Ceraceosorus guamensis TaxID=1522189 RepID=A0A316VV76_9BASI|nr:putative beta-glucosidase [Ceraceosorus guamensis]PWN40201.1 putative beta-glucosidase [Ceraceosorus guamensis]